MATKRMTELSNDLIKVASQIKLLNGEIDKLKKNNATSAEIEAKFGAKLKETLGTYTKTVDAVVKYSKANKGNALSNKALSEGLVRLSSKLNETRVAHNSLIATKNRQTEADKKLIEAQKKLAAEQKKNADLTAKLAKATEKAKNDEAKAFAKAEEKKARDAQKASDKRQKIADAEEQKAKKRGDFFGGIGEAFSPNAIGRAIGSVTKFVSIYSLLTAASNAFRSATLGSIEAFIQFEAALARIRAVAGSTAEETDRLEKSIRQTAGTTVFTLSEVAALAEELLKLGFSADQASAAILPVSQTAQALGENASDVATLLGTVSKEFGLTTAEISNTGDILVGAINRSALSFESFRTAIQYVGPLARQNGVSLSETAAAMGLLANAGFSASRIGTGLRQVFIKLGESGENVIDQLEELSKRGVSLGEALEITDVRTAAAVSTLALAAPLIRQLAEDFEKTGRAAQASAIQTNTFSGQVKLLNSAYNDFQVTLGSVISQSDVLITLIGAFSRTAERAAISARLISDERFNIEKYSEAVSNTASSLDDQAAATKLAREEAEKLVSGVTGDYWFNNRKEVDALTESILKAAKTQDDFRKSVKLTTDFYNDYNEQVKNNEITVEQLSLKLANLNNQLQDGTILTNDQRIAKEAEKKAIEDLILSLGRERDARAKADEEQKSIREKKAKLDADEIKRRKAQIKEEIKLIRDQRQSDLKALEERAKLQGEAATTTEQRASIELKLNQDIADLNDKTNQRLEYQFGQFIQLSDDAGEVIKKYGTEFPNVVEQLSETVNDLNKDFFELSDSIEMSLSDVANDAINDAKSILSTYKKQVDELNESFGENAGKTEEYFAALEQLTSSLGTELLGLADGINRATEEGEAAYQIILQLLGKVEDAAKRPSSRDKQFDWGEFWKETLVDALEESIDIAIDSIDRFNQVAFENTKNRLESQRAAIQAEADIENDILKSQLDNQLITEEEFRNRSEANRKKEVARQNAIDKQIFEAEKKRDKQAALSEYLRALASIIPSLILNDGEANPAALAIKAAITAGLATISYGSQVSAINQREFYPTRFAEGGMVQGPSHAQGGVPFTVQGRGGYEMEGGEFIVNKNATAANIGLLERINNSVKPTPISGSYAYENINRIPAKFAQGGIVSPAEAEQITKEQLTYLRAIAESNVAVANNTGKPVRAFITQTDLRNNDLERRIVNKNSRL